jgi:hypothetical protein
LHKFDTGGFHQQLVEWKKTEMVLGFLHVMQRKSLAPICYSGLKFVFKAYATEYIQGLYEQKGLYFIRQLSHSSYQLDSNSSGIAISLLRKMAEHCMLQLVYVS